MLIDATQFPLVWMQLNITSSTPETAPFSEFEALLTRQQPLVLLNDEGLGKGQHQNSVDEMKYITRWMKSHKSQLQAYVKAAIYIEPDTSKRQATAMFSRVYEKFWGYPLMTVATKEEGLLLARSLLASTDNTLGMSCG